jgi:hypothetical protein
VAGTTPELSGSIGDMSSAAAMDSNSSNVHYTTNNSQRDMTTKVLNQMATMIRHQLDL